MDTDGLVPSDSGVLVLDIGIDNWTRPCCAQTGCRRPRDVFDTKPYAWLQQATKPRVSPYGAMLGQRYNPSDRYLLEGLESMTCGTQHVLHPSHSSARREPFSYPSLGLSFRYSKASWLAPGVHTILLADSGRGLIMDLSLQNMRTIEPTSSISQEFTHTTDII